MIHLVSEMNHEPNQQSIFFNYGNEFLKHVRDKDLTCRVKTELKTFATLGKDKKPL